MDIVINIVNIKTTPVCSTKGFQSNVALKRCLV
nr:MAG TPA: hypothetical protein [Caudoviricetes sp.]